MDKSTLNKVWILRKILAPMSNSEALKFVKEKMNHTDSNEELFKEMTGGTMR
jgi:transcription termination factor Rho